jgi:hypothetical protein
MNKEKTIEDITTQSQREFIEYIGNATANYIENHITMRSDIIAGIIAMSIATFCKETRADLKGQLEEITLFCKHLKGFAREHDARKKAAN